MKRICPRCDTEHTKPGMYCGRSCANARVFSEEAKLKKARSAKKFFENMTAEQRDQYQQRIQTRKPGTGRPLAQILVEDFDSLSYELKRRRVFVEQRFACGCCGLDKWLDVPLTLELEHIDGKHDNNERDNLIGLCPNCHSLSFSWRGRKNKLDPKIIEQRRIVYLNKLLPAVAHGEQGAL